MGCCISGQPPRPGHSLALWFQINSVQFCNSLAGCATLMASSHWQAQPRTFAKKRKGNTQACSHIIPTALHPAFLTLPPQEGQQILQKIQKTSNIFLDNMNECIHTNLLHVALLWTNLLSSEQRNPCFGEKIDFWEREREREKGQLYCRVCTGLGYF